MGRREGGGAGLKLLFDLPFIGSVLSPSPSPVPSCVKVKNGLH